MGCRKPIVSRPVRGNMLLTMLFRTCQHNKKTTPWPESASELYRPSDRRMSAKLVPTFSDRRCHVVSVTDPYGRILGFLDRSRYFSIK
jgi:CBS-domain-containing membrane protein